MDLFRKLGIALVEAFKEIFFRSAVNAVDNVRNVSNAAHLNLLGGSNVGEALAQRFFYNGDHLGGNAVQICDAFHHVNLFFARQLHNHLRGLLAARVGEDERDGLRVLGLQHHLQAAVIRLAHKIERPCLQRFGHALHVAAGALRVERLFQNVLRVQHAALVQRLLRHAHAVEIFHVGLQLFGGNAVQLGNFDGKLFHFVFFQVLVHFRGAVYPQSDHDGGRTLRRRQFF